MKRGDAKLSRPIALNVAASVKCASPAYSVRMSVGESTSKRASPEITADACAPARRAADDRGIAAAAVPDRAALPVSAKAPSAVDLLIRSLRDSVGSWGIADMDGPFPKFDEVDAKPVPE